MSLNPSAKIDIKNYSIAETYATINPTTGTNIFGGKSDVQIKKKVAAKPKHGLLIAAVIIAGTIFLGYKLEERF